PDRDGSPVFAAVSIVSVRKLRGDLECVPRRAGARDRGSEHAAAHVARDGTVFCGARGFSTAAFPEARLGSAVRELALGRADWLFDLVGHGYGARHRSLEGDFRPP